MADDWTPEKEAEDDPIELQKQQLALGREFMDKLKAQEAEEKKRREEYARAEPIYPSAVAPAFKPATFEEVSASIKKAWEETERIMPAAPEQIKLWTVQALVRTMGPQAGYL